MFEPNVNTWTDYLMDLRKGNYYSLFRVHHGPAGHLTGHREEVYQLQHARRPPTLPCWRPSRVSRRSGLKSLFYGACWELGDIWLSSARLGTLMGLFIPSGVGRGVEGWLGTKLVMGYKIGVEATHECNKTISTLMIERELATTLFYVR